MVCFIATSLTSAATSFRKLNALAEAAIEDEKVAERTDVCVDVLNSYLRALRSISNQALWKQLGTEVRGVPDPYYFDIFVQIIGVWYNIY
ncbi:MAG: hypothetical protein PHS38_08845 [Bacteroidales bacterium]|nr:hypothetical protein [Bacteroidales bacterium]